jgi:hypothetical protein
VPSLDNEQLIDIAQLGIEAESFTHSNICRYLTKKADAEEKALTKRLVASDSVDVELGRIIRNELHVIQMFREYLGEIINVGRNAEIALREEDAEDHPTD